MSWFQLALLSIFALALAELTQQHLLAQKRAFNERTSAVFTFLFQGIIALPILHAFGFGDELFSVFSDKRILGYILIVDFIASIGMVYYLRSFKVRNISISTILVSISVIVSTTIGILFINEGLTLYKLFGIALILISIVVVNLRNFEFERNHLFALIGGVLFGVTYSLDKVIVQSISPIIYIFWSFIFVSSMGFAMGSKTVRKGLTGSEVVGLYTDTIIKSWLPRL